jgi:hypothetical protein
MKVIPFRAILFHTVVLVLLLVVTSGPVYANRLWSSGFELNSLADGDEWKKKSVLPSFQ